MPPLIMGRDTPLYACLEPHPKFEDGYKMAGELREMYEADPDTRQVIDVAKGLEGLRRQDGIHAAAVVITKEPLTEYLPIQRKPENGVPVEEAPVVTQYEMHGVEELGLLKMDFLGLRNLDVITDTVDVIRESRGVELDIDNVALDDPKTYELLRRGDTIGVFQLEGGPMRALIRSLAPTSFEDVAALVALYRPGPMAANMHNDYADRKNGRKPVGYLHPDAEDILGDTWGLMIYQEGVMRIAQKFAGYSLAEADNLRKACLPEGHARCSPRSRGYVPIEQTGAPGRSAGPDDRHDIVHEPVRARRRMCGPWGSSRCTGSPRRPATRSRRPTTTRSSSRASGASCATSRRATSSGWRRRTMTDGGSKVTDAEVDLAALLISEGYTPDLRTGIHRNAHFCNTDPELLDTFRRAFERHFGYPHQRASVTAIRHPAASDQGGAARARSGLWARSVSRLTRTSRSASSTLRSTGYDGSSACTSAPMVGLIALGSTSGPRAGRCAAR